MNEFSSSSLLFFLFFLLFFCVIADPGSSSSPSSCQWSWSWRFIEACSNENLSRTVEWREHSIWVFHSAAGFWLRIFSLACYAVSSTSNPHNEFWLWELIEIKADMSGLIEVPPETTCIDPSQASVNLVITSVKFKARLYHGHLCVRVHLSS